MINCLLKLLQHKQGAHMKNDEMFRELLRFLDTISYVKPEQIPDIDLYMDQVTSFMDEHLKKVKRYPDDKVLTKTMINNYTKAKILPAPNRKKYAKEHLYMLLFIYYYKGILSLGDLNTVLRNLNENYFSAGGLDIGHIYKEVFNLENAQMKILKDDLKQKYACAAETFSEGGTGKQLSEDERERLQRFSFICELAFDVYLKKLLIEKLCDRIAEENPQKESPRKLR